MLVLAAIVGGWFYWRSHRTVQLGQKDTIVLADFVNTTGDPVFDGTLKQALAIQLEQSPFLNVLSDRRVSATLKMMNRPPDERLSYEVAREVCLRSNSKALLEGSISSVGSHYLIGLKAVNCQTGDTLASTQAEAANRDNVLKQLGEAGNELREKLGESLISVQHYNKPLDQATTSSLEALKAFTEGRHLQWKEGDAASIPFHKRAVELDPELRPRLCLAGHGVQQPGRVQRGDEELHQGLRVARPGERSRALLYRGQLLQLRNRRTGQGQPELSGVDCRVSRRLRPLRQPSAERDVRWASTRRPRSRRGMPFNWRRTRAPGTAT